MDQISKLVGLVQEYIRRSPKFDGDLLLAKQIGVAVGEVENLGMRCGPHGFAIPCRACIHGSNIGKIK